MTAQDNLNPRQFGISEHPMSSIDHYISGDEGVPMHALVSLNDEYPAPHQPAIDDLVANWGERKPLRVVPGKKTPVLIDGHHHYYAAKKAGLTHYPVDFDEH